MAESSIPILLHSEKCTSFIKYNHLNIKKKVFVPILHESNGEQLYTNKS